MKLLKADSRSFPLWLLFIFCLFSIFCTNVFAWKPDSTGRIPSGFSMVSGETLDLSTVLNDKVSLFCSSDPAVAYISDKGILKAGRPGHARILYSCFGRMHSCRIQVSGSGRKGYDPDAGGRYKAGIGNPEEDPVDISIEKQLLFMKTGDTCKTDYTLTPNNYTTRTSMTWTSSDPSVAKAGSRGQITARKAGNAVITCSVGDSSADIRVNVVDDSYTGKACDFSILTQDGDLRTYRLFKQNAHNYANYNRYLAWHGCATCSLTTVLGAYQPSYKSITPDVVIDGPEKTVASPSAWKKEHRQKALRSQMPISLYGISSILDHYGVKNTYVRTYQEETAKKDITDHLQTGNAVIFEVRQKSNITGKRSKRWTNSYHTMVLLGVLTNGKVLLCDSVDRSWYEGGQRLKIVTLDDVMEYMFPCTSFSKSLYYNGASSDGGYIKIYDND